MYSFIQFFLRGMPTAAGTHMTHTHTHPHMHTHADRENER